MCKTWYFHFKCTSEQTQTFRSINLNENNILVSTDCISGRTKLGNWSETAFEWPGEVEETQDSRVTETRERTTEGRNKARIFFFFSCKACWWVSPTRKMPRRSLGPWGPTADLRLKENFSYSKLARHVWWLQGCEAKISTIPLHCHCQEDQTNGCRIRRKAWKRLNTCFLNLPTEDSTTTHRQSSREGVGDLKLEKATTLAILCPLLLFRKARDSWNPRKCVWKNVVMM